MIGTSASPRPNLFFKVALVTMVSWVLGMGITTLALFIAGAESWVLGLIIASVCALIIPPSTSYCLFKLQYRVEVREQQLRESNARLHEALGQVNKLSGLLPICSSCKRIRNEDGSWDQLESFIETHSEADFTHSLCPECHQKAMGQIDYLKGKHRQQNGW